jgi:hypothetical protein
VKLQISPVFVAWRTTHSRGEQIDATRERNSRVIELRDQASKNLQRPELQLFFSKDRRRSGLSECRSRLGPLFEGRFAVPGRYRLTA